MFILLMRRSSLIGRRASDPATPLRLQVRDVRMISDRNSRRSKGIAYIEFVESSSVPLAIGLTGQRLLAVPIIVQASQVRGEGEGGGASYRSPGARHV